MEVRRRSVPPIVVAVLDSDPDTTELLKSYLEIEGIVVATGSLLDFRLGKADLIEFLKRTAPDVILFDLGLPYEANYVYLQRVREDPAFPRSGFVVTTTNARAVRDLVGIEALEILGKPYDLSVLVTAVRAAAAELPLPWARTEADRRLGDRRQGDRRVDADSRAPGSATH